MLPQTRRARDAQAIAGRTARLELYDWEPNVIGPEGTPAPTDAAATGGLEPGSAKGGLIEYDAVLRAAKRPPIVRSDDTTLTAGCTAAQLGGCAYGSWYLVDSRHEKMLCAGGAICAPRDTKAELYADGYRPPSSSKPRAVHVNPGTVIVQAEPVGVEREPGKVLNASPNSFYVLNDDPALSGADVRNPRQGLEEVGSNLLPHGDSGPPDVDFGFSPHGRTIFERLTRDVARRGQNAQLPGVSKRLAMQHFAIVLDEQVIAAPAIDYTVFPEGIDPTNGSEIDGDFTIASARNLAGELRSGALPLPLQLISQVTVKAARG